MTDERLGDRLYQALRRLPPGSGVVFRHHATAAAERHRVFLIARRIAHARRLIVVVAGAPMPGADGCHARANGNGLTTWPAHDRRQALAGVRAKADALFVSPIFATRSHPGRPGIGIRRATLIGSRMAIPRIALGGMDAKRWRRVRRFGFHGWAAIDAWDCRD